MIFFAKLIKTDNKNSNFPAQSAEEIFFRFQRAQRGEGVQTPALPVGSGPNPPLPLSKVNAHLTPWAGEGAAAVSLKTKLRWRLERTKVRVSPDCSGRVLPFPTCTEGDVWADPTTWFGGCPTEPRLSPSSSGPSLVLLLAGRRSTPSASSETYRWCWSPAQRPVPRWHRTSTRTSSQAKLPNLLPETGPLKPRSRALYVGLNRDYPMKSQNFNIESG